MDRKHLSAVVVGIAGLLVIIVIAVTYSDLLGIRTLKKAEARVFAYEGELITFVISDSDQVRKLEICEEQMNIILGRSDFIKCRSLKDFVAAHQTRVDARIPKGLGRRVVITRYRGPGGALLTTGPVLEKITLFILRARASSGGSANQNTSSGSGSGSSGGGNTASTREIILKPAATPTPTPSSTVTATPPPTNPTTTPAPRRTQTPTPTATPTPTPSPTPYKSPTPSPSPY